MSEELTPTQPVNPTGGIPLQGLVEDITSTLTDLAPEDRVYRVAGSMVVKIKALIVDDKAPAMAGHILKVSLTGSICNAQGKAIIRADKPVVWVLGQTHHFKAEGDDDPVAMLEEARRRCIAQTVRAEKHWQMMSNPQEPTISGLTTLADYQARKAREMATTTTPTTTAT